jgi:hypothetical protein
MVGVEALGYRCPVCDGTPCVGVAVEYRGVRKLIGELLDRDGGCWQICPLHAAAEMPAQVGAGTRPALVIVDAADANAALRAGAGAWLCRERIGEELGAAMRTLLGCTHRPGLVP